MLTIINILYCFGSDFNLVLKITKIKMPNKIKSNPSLQNKPYIINCKIANIPSIYS